MTVEHVAQTTIEFGPPHTPEEAAEIRAELRRYVADRILLADQYDELLAKHDEQWAAMCDGVLFTASNLDDLLGVLRASGVHPGRAAVRFLSRVQQPHVHYS